MPQDAFRRVEAMSGTKPLKTGRTEAQVLAQILEAASMLGLDLDRRNTGAGVNPSGKMVRFGKPGDSDLNGTLPDGRTLHVECKHECFEPTKLRGEKREHFERQLTRLQKTNALGGVGFFCDRSDVFLRVMQIVLRGGWVEQTEYDLIVYDPEIIEEQHD
jgi:hypothetical protein